MVPNFDARRNLLSMRQWLVVVILVKFLLPQSWTLDIKTRPITGQSRGHHQTIWHWDCHFSTVFQIIGTNVLVSIFTQLLVLPLLLFLSYIQLNFVENISLYSWQNSIKKITNKTIFLTINTSSNKNLQPVLSVVNNINVQDIRSKI